MWSFYKAFFKSPRSVGSGIPSSPWLAKAIASFVPSSGEYILELGAGTGAITSALLQKEIPPNHLILVEKSEPLVDKLSKKFPQIQIIHGDARYLTALLKNCNLPINTIVSSLPLLSLPKDVKSDIVKEIETLLKPGNYYIQFTYGLAPSIFEYKDRFHKIASKQIWLNLPPARIDVFKIKP